MSYEQYKNMLTEPPAPVISKKYSSVVISIVYATKKLFNL